jgi:hypothetical protein
MVSGDTSEGGDSGAVLISSGSVKQGSSGQLNIQTGKSQDGAAGGINWQQVRVLKELTYLSVPVHRPNLVARAVTF